MIVVEVVVVVVVVIIGWYNMIYLNSPVVNFYTLTYLRLRSGLAHRTTGFGTGGTTLYPKVR